MKFILAAMCAIGGALGMSSGQAVVAQNVALPAPAQAPVDFARDIEPIFKARCYSCHGPALSSSGLRLDEAEAALKGGYSGAVILPGDSANSRLIALVA